MRFLTTLIFFFSTIFALSGQSHQLTVGIDGLQTPLCYLGSYYGDKELKIDSSYQDSTTLTFSFDISRLEAGKYYFCTPGFKIFDLIITDSTESFTILGSLVSPDSLRALNSRENELFFEYERELRRKETGYQTLMQQLAVLKQTKADSLGQVQLEQKITRASQELLLVNALYIQLHPNQLFTKMLKSVQYPKAPINLPVLTPDGKRNPEHFKWVQHHYWDNNDFNDPSLLRNQQWVRYLNNYLQQFTELHPDSINSAIDRLLVKMPRQSAFFQFTAPYLARQFETVTWQSADRVFVHIVDRWLPIDSSSFLDTQVLKRLHQKADFHRPNMTGSLAPPLNLISPDGSSFDLYSIEADLTLLVFYSPSNRQCMQDMPAIYQRFLNARPKGLVAIAVSVDGQNEDWRAFLSSQGWEWMNGADPEGKNAFLKSYGVFNLPVIYLLDRDKNILQKRIRPTQLQKSLDYFLNNPEK